MSTEQESEVAEVYLQFKNLSDSDAQGVFLRDLAIRAPHLSEKVGELIRFEEQAESLFGQLRVVPETDISPQPGTERGWE